MVASLILTRTTITFMALIGVVVNIGIVLAAHINELRSTGMERMAAIVQAGSDRLFVVPAFYVWIDNGAERVKRFMRRARVVDARPSPAGVSEAGL